MFETVSLKVENFYPHTESWPYGPAAADQPGFPVLLLRLKSSMAPKPMKRWVTSVPEFDRDPSPVAFEMLVLDEPCLSLDPDWRRALHAHLRDLAAAGRGVLVATHLLGEWEGQADRCLVLDDGQVEREVSSARLRDAFPFTLPQAALASLG